ncbi:deoxynucleotide monophosphate kinase family protein [Streptomyces mirabilis]
MRNIALIGQARSGKDTAAAWLVRERAYVRLAFADPLKDMALRIDPYIPTTYRVTVRLSALIADVGWEYAKDRYPEVRAMLQRMGQTQREFDEDYWVRILARKVEGAAKWNIPTVVTDVRYPNEAQALTALGFTLVRIVRPEVASAGAQLHESERALLDYPADRTIYNTATIADLERRISEV